ncbi:MAG: exodeoxyribonuclease I [Cytophagales bacterium]|nr:exodeoxyribonuclease I [Cytophagales bacterium]
MTTFLFYDLETSGLNPCFDQVLQFAAIRTDMELQELERHELRIRMRPDVIPSPEAILTTQIALKDWEELDTNEYEGIKKIHRMFNEPNTISLGYNTLGFDDEFLRFSFYRNLLDMYSHQFAQGCMRADLFPMMSFYYLFRPEVLKWPRIDGKVSLKLEELNRANQLAEGQAHDAMVDVEATVALAHRLKSHEDMWAYCLSQFSKKKDEQLSRKAMSSSKDFPTALLVSPRMGSDKDFQAPVLFLGTNFMNQQLFMRLDQFLFEDIDKDSIEESSWVIRKKGGEPPFVVPVSRRKSSGQGETEKSNFDWLNAFPFEFEKIKAYWLAYKYPEVERVDMDARLYLDSFWSAEDKQLNRMFHEAETLEDKWKASEAMLNPNLRTLSRRIIFRNYFLKLEEKEAQEAKDFFWKMLNDETVDFRNAPRKCAEKVMEELKAKLPLLTKGEEASLLLQLKECLRQRIEVLA